MRDLPLLTLSCDGEEFGVVEAELLRREVGPAKGLWCGVPVVAEWVPTAAQEFVPRGVDRSAGDVVRRDRSRVDKEDHGVVVGALRLGSRSGRREGRKSGGGHFRGLDGVQRFLTFRIHCFRGSSADVSIFSDRF